MAIYKISDVLKTIKSMQKDGFEYVDISVVEADEDSLASLCIEAIIDSDSTETDFVDAVTLPDDYVYPLG